MDFADETETDVVSAAAVVVVVAGDAVVIAAGNNGVVDGLEAGTVEKIPFSFQLFPYV